MLVLLGDIRNRIITQGGDENGTVRYATRRTFVSELTFEMKSTHIDIDASLDQKFIEISNRQASFNNMSVDEYSTIVNNCISQYAIDYYLSHTMSSKKENVVCEHIDMSSLQLTLEVLSSIYNMKIYSLPY